MVQKKQKVLKKVVLRKRRLKLFNYKNVKKLILKHRQRMVQKYLYCGVRER
jgi:hypothetical protein